MSDRVSSKEVHFHCFGKMDKLNFQEELTTQLEEQKSNGKIRWNTPYFGPIFSKIHEFWEELEVLVFRIIEEVSKVFSFDSFLRNCTQKSLLCTRSQSKTGTRNGIQHNRFSSLVKKPANYDQNSITNWNNNCQKSNHFRQLFKKKVPNNSLQTRNLKWEKIQQLWGDEHKK